MSGLFSVDRSGLRENIDQFCNYLKKMGDKIVQMPIQFSREILFFFLKIRIKYIQIYYNKSLQKYNF